MNVTNGVTILIFASYFDKTTATLAWSSNTKTPALPGLSCYVIATLKQLFWKVCWDLEYR